MAAEMNNNGDAEMQKNLSLSLSKLELLPDGGIFNLDVIQGLSWDENPEMPRSNNGKDKEIDVFEIVCSGGYANVQNSNHSKDEKPNSLLSSASQNEKSDGLFSH
ncbi:hypothetical protein QYM36_007887 [Artemia franciscana]|uniref:Uncharacterized protein n=1 Tax=Artemia franciscana TaxID=6661 RepID=A0AA88IEH7_ARTSF|nr:hypothetical protein QYM36_007887 [Artemia franciscana]